MKLTDILNHEVSRTMQEAQESGATTGAEIVSYVHNLKMDQIQEMLSALPSMINDIEEAKQYYGTYMEESRKFHTDCPNPTMENHLTFIIGFVNQYGPGTALYPISSAAKIYVEGFESLAMALQEEAEANAQEEESGP